MMLDPGWWCSYSYFWSSAVVFPGSLLFNVTVACRKSATINPVHFTSCFFTFEYTSIRLATKGSRCGFSRRRSNRSRAALVKRSADFLQIN